jgi:hypothetical protein
MTLIRRKCGSGHTYTLDNRPVKGVTTLIKLGYPAPGLIGWTGKVVATWVADADDDALAALRALGRDPMIAALRSMPFADRNKASDRGRLVHTLAERLSKGERLTFGLDIDEDLEGHVESVLRFLDEWSVTPILTETVVGNRWIPYAGTLDMIADIPGYGRVLLDYKTGASGIWPETVLQLAAYRYADFFVADAAGLEMPMTELGIEHTWAVWVRADGYDVIPCDTGPDLDTSPAFRAFRGAAYTARRVDTIPPLIGEALPAPSGVTA